MPPPTNPIELVDGLTAVKAAGNAAGFIREVLAEMQTELKRQCLARGVTEVDTARPIVGEILLRIIDRRLQADVNRLYFAAGISARDAWDTAVALDQVNQRVIEVKRMFLEIINRR